MTLPKISQKIKLLIKLDIRSKRFATLGPKPGASHYNSGRDGAYLAPPLNHLQLF